MSSDPVAAPWAPSVPKLGVGVAYQATMRSFLEEQPDAYDFLEVVPDILWTDFGRGHAPRYVDDPDGIAFLRRIAAAKVVIPHSIGLSIGSAHRFNREHLGQLQRWHDWLQFPWHSDHLSFCLTALRLLRLSGALAGGEAEVNIGLTMPLPRDRETIELLAPRVVEVHRSVPATFLLENNVYFFDFADAEFGEAEFLNLISRATGAGLLLDLHNLYVNSRNMGVDPWRFLDELELDRVVEIHVAGGFARDGYYLDAHSGPLPEPLWELLERVTPCCPNLGGIVFELFGTWFPELGADRLRAELWRLREVWSRCQPSPVRMTA